MSTHDIELPKPFMTVYDDVDKVEVGCYSEIQVRAAIEADRQARGEPIGEVLAFPMGDKPKTHSTLAGLENPQPVGMLVYAAPQPQQIPEGYKLVPIEPTREMVRAGWLIPLTGGDEIMADCDPDIEKIYRAMLEAAPEVKEKP